MPTMRDSTTNSETSMTEARQSAKGTPAAAPSVARVEATDDAERALARAVSWGLPILTVTSALAVGVFGSIGSAILVLAAGAMLGAIALLWGSLRTLSGDAPLPEDAHTGAAFDGSELGERKLRVLLALKDLENEHELGKIDDADYDQLVARYRDDAKQVLRELDERAQPSREEAEEVAREFLARNGIGRSNATRPPEPTVTTPAGRPACPSCRGSNDLDAAFCKHCGASMKRAREDAGGRHAKA
jgi:hypothetical protein